MTGIVPSFQPGPQIVEPAGVAGQIDYIIAQYLTGHYEQIPWREETVAMYEMNMEAIAGWKAAGCPHGAMIALRPYAEVILPILSGSLSLTGAIL